MALPSGFGAAQTEQSMVYVTPVKRRRPGSRAAVLTRMGRKELHNDTCSRTLSVTVNTSTVKTSVPKVQFPNIWKGKKKRRKNEVRSDIRQTDGGAS